MDAPMFSVIVSSTWLAIQPLLSLITIKGTEEIVKLSSTEIWKSIKKKFDRKPETKQIIVDLLQNPQDSDVQGAFRFQLKQFLQEDPAFVSHLSGLLKDAGMMVTSEDKASDGSALAQGDGASAVSRGNVMIGGDAKDNIIITGDENELKGRK
jgi:hypothetical protein